jgi:hypothetical protein
MRNFQRGAKQYANLVGVAYRTAPCSSDNQETQTEPRVQGWLRRNFLNAAATPPHEGNKPALTFGVNSHTTQADELRCTKSSMDGLHEERTCFESRCSFNLTGSSASDQSGYASRRCPRTPRFATLGQVYSPREEGWLRH